MKSLNNPQEFLQAVLEGFVDGILVLTAEKEQKYANTMAIRLCHHLSNNREAIPKEIWQVCEALIESRELYPNQSIAIESEVDTATVKLRIRAHWLMLDTNHPPCLLVRLQDQNQAVQGLAIAEAQTWGLTDRETEVWIHRRSGCSRKQIAEDLYIAVDTVKKHLKNIQNKRQSYLNEEEWQVSQGQSDRKILCSV
jgi:DNA-binding CsgD family transcriptional regulator